MIRHGRAAAIEALVGAADALAGASLNATPNCMRLRAWMEAARVGDLVVVHQVRPGARADDRVGYLRSVIETEPAEGAARGYPVWTIERLSDGRLSRWENVQVLRIPRDVGEERERWLAAMSA